MTTAEKEQRIKERERELYGESPSYTAYYIDPADQLRDSINSLLHRPPPPVHPTSFQELPMHKLVATLETFAAASRRTNSDGAADAFTIAADMVRRALCPDCKGCGKRNPFLPPYHLAPAPCPRCAGTGRAKP